MISRTFRQPRLHLWIFVRRIVVGDKVHIQIHGHIRIDMSKKREKFLMPMSRFALRNHLATSNIQGGKQSRRSVPCWMPCFFASLFKRLMILIASLLSVG